jgi:potassium efflux system protein
VGDAVSVGDFSGRVADIRMRATTVALWDRSEMIVPNKEFITAKLINWTLSHPETRVELKVGIAYCSDVELVRKLLFDIATANPNVLKTPAPDVFLTAFGSSSIDFLVQAYGLFDYGRPKLIDELYRAIYQEFGRHGISIAFPQLDVHVRTVASEIRSRALGTAG